MIVRDEEQTLARCLDSVQGVFDEIVIVDTGSTDRTKEVAGRFTPNVLDFGWIDDFAEARNHAFDHATADFVMWLDADDVLLPADRAKLLELKKSLGPPVDAVTSVYHTAFDDSGNLVASTRRIRIIRRGSGFRWVGAIHEDLVTGQQYHYLDTDIVITHRKPDSRAGVSYRNRRIFEKMLAEGTPMRPVDELNYARELQATKDFDAAIPHYERFLASEPADPDRHLFALHKLATCYYMTGQRDKEWECTLKSLELDAPRPEFSCRIGERFLSRNQFQQAIFWYETALTNPAAHRTETVENHAFATWLPHKQLGMCYFQVGNLEKSLHHTRIAQSYQPEDQTYAANIAMLEALIAERNEAGTSG